MDIHDHGPLHVEAVSDTIDSILLGTLGGHVVSCIYLGIWGESHITDPTPGMFMIMIQHVAQLSVHVTTSLFTTE